MSTFLLILLNIKQSACWPDFDLIFHLIIFKIVFISPCWSAFYFWSMDFKKLFFMNSIFSLCIWNWNFSRYTGSKNEVWTGPKMEIIPVHFSKSIFQKSSTDQQGVCINKIKSNAILYYMLRIILFYSDISIHKNQLGTLYFSLEVCVYVLNNAAILLKQKAFLSRSA